MINIDKELFRKTEGKLYRYYGHTRLIEKLRDKVMLLTQQKEAIRREMQELKHIQLESDLNMGIDYSMEKIQSSGTSTSVAENQMVKYIERLEKDYKHTIRSIGKINSRIREIELEMQSIGYNISLLGEEDKRFLELKYGDKKNILQISLKLNIAQATAYRKREELIQAISEYDNMLLK
ncbi:transcriptional regulator [Clostridium cadaveris]|uniref:transcriptional regulator n=1 Tax=Clostridium cadaveris TaxID=1529 RepID=UPI001E41E4B5|nr:transcriptional regulator [Clostridium cadaveris]UFH63877.1 transcriptional regulator [Clostridium cadaveris]